VGRQCQTNNILRVALGVSILPLSTISIKIKESNLMQYKEQQKSNAIFIKKHFLSVRQDS
jgi:hypothetical protein